MIGNGKRRGRGEEREEERGWKERGWEKERREESASEKGRGIRHCQP